MRGVQNALYIDMVVALHTEDDVRVAWNQPETQVRVVQFMGVSRRARGGMATDVAVDRSPIVLPSRERLSGAHAGCVHRP